MRWKLWLVLFIVIGITGLLLFSEKGRELNKNYLARYTKAIGDFLRSITGRFKIPVDVNRTLQVTITTSPGNLKGIEFNLVENSLTCELVYETASVGDQNIGVKDKSEMDFETESMTGTVFFDETGNVRISGKSASVDLNGIFFTPKTGEDKIEFLLVGTPSSFSLSDVGNDRMTLSGISGLLRLSNWSPLALDNDNLDISYFKGNIEQNGDSVTISGNVEKISLNGVDLSLKM
jgi:hypothetical protein